MVTVVVGMTQMREVEFVPDGDMHLDKLCWSLVRLEFTCVPPSPSLTCRVVLLHFLSFMMEAGKV
ncbi:hypothetical protein O3P69_016149 [Scylla paramamosain]|uniref:Uncharacterized protein n=1 Tax=Scylla paramamosain TaxID=85552 RepID=A0AAW0SGR8_SCYPA